MRTIQRAWITTNQSCNLRCKWCYALPALDNSVELPIDIARQIVDTVYSLGVKNITLIGGEPTVYSEITTLIEYIKEKESPIRVGMTTNGIMLSGQSYAKKLVDAGLNGCNISIKGLSEIEYTENTGCSEGFLKTIEGYHNMSELGLDVTASYVIAHEGTEQIDRLYEFCCSNSIKRILIQFVKPTIKLESESLMSMAEMGRITDYIYNNWGPLVDYNVEVSFPVCLITQNIYEDMIRKKLITSGCHVQTGTGINYDVYGRVIPCNHFIGLPYLSEKTLSAEAVKSLRSEDMYKKVKAKASSYPSEKCKTCHYLERCGGGCFTRWFYEEPSNVI